MVNILVVLMAVAVFVVPVVWAYEEQRRIRRFFRFGKLVFYNRLVRARKQALRARARQVALLANGTGWSLLPKKLAYDVVELTIGVLLAETSPSFTGLDIQKYDYRYVRPALAAAASEAQRRYHVKIRYINATHGPCNNTDYREATEAAGELLDQNIALLLASPCTAEFLLQAGMGTRTNTPVFAGFAPLALNIRQYPNVVRVSMSTATQWNLFFSLCKVYNWTRVATIYDSKDESQVLTNSETCFLEGGRWLRHALELLYLFADFTNLARSNYSLEVFPTKLDTSSGAFDFSNCTVCQSALTEVVSRARVVLLLFDTLSPTKARSCAQLRQVMIEAYKLGMCNGSYAFFAWDLNQDGPSGQNGWRALDGQDAIALDAYRSLQVFTVNTTRYRNATTAFRKTIRESNYWLFNYPPEETSYLPVTYYNAVILAAQAFYRFYFVDRRYDETPPRTIKGDNYFVQNDCWNAMVQNGAVGPFTTRDHGEMYESIDMGDLLPSEDMFRDTACTYYGESGVTNCWRLPQWPGTVPPANQPPCGFDGSHCSSPVPVEQPVPVVAIGSVSGAAVFMLLFVLSSYYIRQARANQMVRMSWLARWQDLTLPTSAVATDEAGKTDANVLLRDFNESERDLRQLKVIQAQDIAVYGRIRPYGIYWKNTLHMSRPSKKYRLHASKRVVNEIREAEQLKNENIASLEGACLDADHVMALYEYCSKGSFMDILLTVEHKLDWTIRFSLLNDIVKGLTYIHQSPIACHGRLTSACCFIDMRFGLKIADAGLHSFFELSVAEMWAAKREATFFANMLWTPPERLRGDVSNQSDYRTATKAADIYSFGIIMQETVFRIKPFGMFGAMSAEEIVDELKKIQVPGDEGFKPFRPVLSEEHADTSFVDLASRCWAQNPGDRPGILQVKVMMKDLGRHLGFGEKGSILDTLLEQMDDLMTNLQHLIEEREKTLLEHKTQSDSLLFDIVPQILAERMKRGEKILPETFESCTIMLVSIDNFPRITADSTALQITEFLLDFHEYLELHIGRQDCVKADFHESMSTVVSGAPVRNGLSHGVEIAKASLRLLYSSLRLKIRHRPNEIMRLSAGVNSGSCVGGIVGHVLPRYCLFGETTQIGLTLLESAEEITVRCSAATKDLLTDQFELQENGEVFVKGKGVVVCYTIRGVSGDEELESLEEQFHYDMMEFRARRLADTRKGPPSRFKGRSLTSRI